MTCENSSKDKNSFVIDSTLYNHLLRMVREKCYCCKINRSECDIVTCCDHCARLSWFKEFVNSLSEQVAKLYPSHEGWQYDSKYTGANYALDDVLEIINWGEIQ